MHETPPADLSMASLDNPVLEHDQRFTAGQFALEVMHELRNPLETLANLNYLILHAADDPDQVRNYALLGEEQLRMLSRIAHQSLDFARLSESPKAVNLVDLAEAALRIHQRTVQAKHIHLMTRLPIDLIEEVRQGQLLQVFSNLIGNALDALPDNGKLAVRLRRSHKNIEIIVADNGPGVPAVHVKELFLPFFTTKGEGGNGLGLSLSKRIVDDHGGKIGFRTSCRADRSGTVFKVSLPLKR